jgi:hypothetical protein
MGHVISQAEGGWLLMARTSVSITGDFMRVMADELALQRDFSEFLSFSTPIHYSAVDSYPSPLPQTSKK